MSLENERVIQNVIIGSEPEQGSNSAKHHGENMKTITPCRPKWTGTLTDRERFIRQMHYQPVDRS
jgi:hypothetical protein